MESNRFSESYYLKHPEVLNELEDIIRYHHREEARVQVKYKTVLRLYDEFIGEVASLIKELGYSSSIEASIILSYLINNGYLSYEMEFKDYSPLPEREIPGHLGTSIITGEGCCRNLAKMHEEVLKGLNLFSKQFYCYQGTTLFGKPDKSEANHVINLIAYQNNKYGIDIYNGNKLYHFKDPLTMAEIGTYTSFSLRNKPYYGVMRGEITIQEMLEELKEYESLSKSRVISALDFNDMKYNTKRKLLESQPRLNRFHEKTKTLKKTIVAEMDYIQDSKNFT